MNESIAAEQGSADNQSVRLQQKASQLWESQQFDEALKLFEESVSDDPANPVLHVNLARAYGMNYQHERAAEVTRKIAKRFGDQTGVFFMLGESDFRYGHLASAATYFQSAIDHGLDQKHEVRAFVFLATIYERLHRLDDAVAAADQALTKWPDQPRALLAKAKVIERLGQRDDAMKLFRQIADREDISPDVKSEAWYAISHMLDRDGNYTEAFEACLQAKQAYRGKTAGAKKTSIKIQHRQRHILSHIESKSSIGPTRKRQLDPLSTSGVVWHLGHPRSGTTLLSQILGAHSGATNADEVRVFATSILPRLLKMIDATGTGVSTIDKLSDATATQLNSLRSTFLQQTEGAIQQSVDGQMLVSKNPDETFLIPFFLDVFPESKIIFSLRDPRDVIVSCFMQSLPFNPTSINYFSLESTAAAYALTMNLWLALRERLETPWLEVRYEDVVNELDDQARRALDFLELPWEPSVLKFNRSAREQPIQSPTYVDVTEPIYSRSIGRWKNYAAQLDPVLDLLHPYLKAFGYN